LRILTQQRLDDADVLDELAPVDRAQETQAADAVADGDLVRRLLLILRLDQLLDGTTLFFTARSCDPIRVVRYGGCD
jgi:hypothetical protein